MKAHDRRWFLAAAVLCSLTSSVQSQQAKQLLSRHVPAAVSSGQAKPIGYLPASQRINLSIVLPLRNQAQLTSFLRGLYDPSSRDYRHYLRVDQFTEQFGPTAEDYQKVVDYARANGLEVHGIAANRLTVSLSGTVSDVEQAFNVKIKKYQHPTENRTFFSADREPSLDLAVPVAHITGLNNFSPPQPMGIKPSPKRESSAQTLSPATVQGSGPGGSYLGSDMRAAYYGGSALTGNGQIVGLAQFDGYNISDVDQTFSNAGQYYSVPIEDVLLDGATGSPCQFTPDPCSDAEQVLDIVQAIGMAPGLSQVRVYIGNSDADILSAMASENIAKQLSISWTWVPDDPATDDPFFQEFAAQGQTVFVASGDYGSYFQEPLLIQLKTPMLPPWAVRH